MKFKPRIQGVAIVLNGVFAPTRFSPAWLRMVGVIDEDVYSAAKTVLITPEATRVDLDFIKFQVLPQQMSVDTSKVPFVRVADFVVQIFRHALPHNVIAQLGILLGHVRTGLAVWRGDRRVRCEP